MNNDNGITKAIIKDNNIFCGKCKHKLAECKALRHCLGNGSIFIKCKHIDKGKYCNEVNEIVL